jgi:hypothetical protein
MKYNKELPDLRQQVNAFSEQAQLMNLHRTSSQYTLRPRSASCSNLAHIVSVCLANYAYAFRATGAYNKDQYFPFSGQIIRCVIN